MLEPQFQNVTPFTLRHRAQFLPDPPLRPCRSCASTARAAPRHAAAPAPVNGRPVRLAPRRPGASPTIRSRATGSPNEATGALCQPGKLIPLARRNAAILLIDDGPDILSILNRLVHARFGRGLADLRGLSFGQVHVVPLLSRVEVGLLGAVREATGSYAVGLALCALAFAAGIAACVMSGTIAQRGTIS